MAEQNTTVVSHNDVTVLPKQGEGVPFATAESLQGPVDAQAPAAVSAALLAQAKWWILGTMALVIVAALPLIWLLVRPSYQAKALVRVSPKSLRIAFKNEDNSSVSFYKTFVNTQVSIIRGPSVLQRVLDQERVRETEWYREAPKPWFGNAPSHLERLTGTIATKISRDSELIEVAVSALKASDAKTLVNAVVDEYKKFSDETIREVDIQRFETIVEEHSRVQKEIEGLINVKCSVAKQLGTASPEELRSQLITQLGRLDEEYGRLERTLRLVQSDREWLARTEAEQSGGEGKGAEEGQQLYARDPEWRRLHLGLLSVRHESELAQQQYGEEHPKMKELRANIEHAESLLAERESQLNEAGPLGGPGGESPQDGAWSPLSIATLERQGERLERQLAMLRDEIGKQKAKVTAAGDLAGDLAKYDEQIRQKRELGTTLHTRMTELELEGKAPARISVEAHAAEPSRPDQDRRVLYSVLAIMGAFVAGLGAGYVRTVLDPRIREAADVRQSLRVPFLGQLPPLPTTQLIMEGCSPYLIESVRIVRTALLERFGPGGKGVVLITSTTSGTGKTSLAALLAGSLAALGKKTLLVEADLRRPSLGGRLGLQSPVGLAALLIGTADDKRVVLSGGTRKLDVILAGDVPGDLDPECLANDVLASAMARWRKSYDFVLVDSPPVLPVADARILARWTDGTLMVLRSSHTRRSDVIQANADLCAAGCSLLGTVLVGTRVGPGYGYGYDAGYARPASTPKALEAVS